MDRKKVEILIYGKDQALLVSGLAVLFMVVHHIFGFDHLRLEDNVLVPLIEVYGISLGKVFAAFGKICVAVFAFNTGYVMWKKREDYTFTNNVRRILKFIISYWIVYLLFLCYGLVSQEQMPTLSVFFLNLIGLHTGTFVQSVNVPYAWYVCFYIFFIFSSPVIIRLSSMKKRGCIFFFLLWFVVAQLYSLIGMQGILGEALKIYISVGINALTGIFFSKYHLFDFFSKYLPKDFLKSELLFLLLIAVRQLSILLFMATYLDIVYAPLFVFLTVNIMSYVNRYPLFIRLFKILGKYSMNIWFLHGIFFMGTMKLQWILYLPKQSIFVLVWGLFLIIILSKFVTSIQNFVLKRVGLRQ